MKGMLLSKWSITLVSIINSCGLSHAQWIMNVHQMVNSSDFTTTPRHIKGKLFYVVHYMLMVFGSKGYPLHGEGYLTLCDTDYELDYDKISVLCREIWDMYVRDYAWHKMPVTVHKVLVHGPYVIRHCFLPIGMMSEEAQETRNKHLKQYREHFARKSSRMNTITDVFNRLLVTSDPYLLSLRQMSRKAKSDLQ